MKSNTPVVFVILKYCSAVELQRCINCVTELKKYFYLGGVIFYLIPDQ